MTKSAQGGPKRGARQRPRARLEHLSARRERVTAGGGHTWFVRITKFTLPLVALALIGITARLMHDPNLVPAPLPAAPGATTAGGTPGGATPAQMDLIKPKYEGKDDAGRPYTISADRARRVMGQDQAVSLDNPKGDVTLEDGTWVAVNSPAGLYNRTTSNLYLSGGVAIFHDDGYEMHLKDITVDIKTRHAQSRFPVSGQGPMGAIEGQNLDISDGGSLIVFGGPAKLTLWKLSGKPGDPG